MKIPLELPAGLVGDDTDFATGGWEDGSNLRFWRGKPEIVKGWERLSTDTLGGVCRSAMGFTDADGVLNFAFGCHDGLWAWQGGALVEITPASVAATGTITISGTPSADQTFVVGAQTFTFKVSRTGTGQVTISGTPATQAANIVSAITADLATVTAAAVSNVVTVTAATAGVAGNSIVLTENATGVAVSGSGTLSGGSGFVEGQIDGTGSAGYGTGAYGVGGYGEPSTDDFFPLTWSYGTRYGTLYANPRGQGVFQWSADIAADATALTNAPAVCNFLLSTSTGQLMALGCTTTSGVYNQACIRISDVLLPTDWTPASDSTAQQYFLEGNGRIVAGRRIGDAVFIWTDAELHVGTYSTEWTFNRVDGNCGLAGPNAAVVLGQVAYWVTPDLQFMSCPLGGIPQIMVSPLREEFADNAATSQNDKIVAGSVSEKAEIRWFYADARDGLEVSRYLAVSTVDGAWTKGQLARTAFIDSNPAPSPVGVTYGGTIYWHERGNSADGATLASSITTGGQYMDPAESVMMLRGLWPDIKDQVGPLNLTIWTRFYPQEDEVMHGPFVLAPGASKVDFLVTGRIFRFHFAGDSSPSSWRFGKPVFDAEIRGDR